MNPPSIHQIQSEQQSREAASTSAALAKEARVAITNASTLLSGDQLVVSVAEAGRLLGVSRAFAYELAARGELPTIRLGRRIVVPKVALLAMVGLSFSQS
jgi:excisionase family DNA binding protein